VLSGQMLDQGGGGHAVGGVDAGTGRNKRSYNGIKLQDPWILSASGSWLPHWTINLLVFF
jgi:hypothetical protein